MGRHDERDRGQAVLLMVAVVACCALLAVGIGNLGGALTARQQAQVAADAAALAGVEGGRVAAADLAGANGATLVSYDEVSLPGGSTVTVTVSVTVSVDGITASARATNGP